MVFTLSGKTRIEAVLKSLFLRTYRFLLKKEPSEKVYGFLTNFSYLALAEVIGSVIGFPIKILVGRFLGPVEYGKYALILNLTQFFIIPMILGFATATVRYLSSHPEKKSQIVGSITILTLSTTSFFSIFFLITHTFWENLFNLPAGIFWWTIAYSAIYVLYYVGEAFQRGLQRFSLLFWITIVNSITLLIVFLVLLFAFHQSTYETFITANIVAFGISCIIFTYYIIKDKPRLRFEKTLTNQIIGYSGWATIGGITGFLIGNTDRLFLNHYVSLYWVGVYAAYTNASTVIIGRFFQLFLNVYFPTVAKEKDKGAVAAAVRHIYSLAVIPVFLISFFSIWAIIWLFGDQFPVRFDLIILFSINNCLMILYQLYMWIFNAQGNRGMRATSTILVFNSILNITLYYLLIQSFGVIGALISTLTVNAVFILYYRNQLKRFHSKGYFNE